MGCGVDKCMGDKIKTKDSKIFSAELSFEIVVSVREFRELREF